MTGQLQQHVEKGQLETPVEYAIDSEAGLKTSTRQEQVNEPDIIPNGGLVAWMQGETV